MALLDTGVNTGAGTEFAWDGAQLEALDCADEGQRVLVTGPAGSGRTSLALEAARRRLTSSESGGQWAPALVLTPDRRRATRLDRALSASIGPQATKRLTAPGSHRLVRSVDSFGYLVVGSWLIERARPLPRPSLVSGAREDGWIARYLEEHEEQWAPHFAPAVLSSPRFRMELRNLMARSGQAGLLPQDLRWLGEVTSLPTWQLAGQVYEDYAGGEKAFTPETPNLDSARLPLIAANVLENWDAQSEEAGVLAPKPVPDLVVVDDLQDIPLAAVPLLRALVGAGAGLFATWAPKQSVSQFRGGTAQTGVEVATALSPKVVELDINHRAAPLVAGLDEVVASWVPSTALPGEKASPAVEEVGDAVWKAREGGTVSAALAPSRTRMYEQVERYLRQQNLQGTEWADMAVIVRSADEVEAVRQTLSRRAVPLEGGERPVVLAKIPVCATLLRLLADPVSQEEALEETGLDEDQALMDLLISPLVDADPLDIYRLLRSLRLLKGDQTLGIAELVDEENFEELSKSNDNKAVLRQVRRAKQLWEEREGAKQLPAEEGLWHLWSVAGVAEGLRETAVGTGRWAAQANDTLDAVLALFRKADFWQQEQSGLGGGVDAELFAKDILSQQVQTDPLVASGIQSRGVAVLTPTQAVGRQWDTVVIPGLQQGSWPRAAKDSLGQLDRLAGIFEDARARGWPGQVPIAPYLPDPGVLAHRASVAGEKRVGEARMFYAAVGRAKGSVRLMAVKNEDEQPSIFLSLLGEQQVVDPAFDVLPASVSMESKVFELRHEVLGLHGDEQLQVAAAKALALLAAEGEENASPTLWAPVGVVTNRKPLFSDKQVRLSPSKLQVAQNCALRWFLDTTGAADQELDEDPAAFSALKRGLMVHAIAEEHPQGTKAELRAALDEKWAETDWDDGTTWARRDYLETRDMVDRLAAYYQTVPEGTTIKTEQPIDFSVGDTVVSGRVDRIEFRPSADGDTRGFVIDIKTGVLPSRAQAQDSLQLLAYQVGLEKAGVGTGGAALWSPKQGVKGTLRDQKRLTPEDLVEAEQKLADLAETLIGPELTANPETGDCDTCPFILVCPAQPAAVRGME